MIMRLKKFFAVLALTGMMAGLLSWPGVSFSASEQPSFSDVSKKTSFYIPVEYLAAHGLIKGYSDGTFRPEQYVNRAEALAMILKSAGITPEGGGRAQFADVTKRKWFFATVNTGKALDLAQGFENGKYFKPYRRVTLVEALRMLFAAQHTDTSTIPTEDLPARENVAKAPPNVAPKAWYTNDVLYAVATTMISQQENGKIFQPDMPLKRGELAVLLYRFLKNKTDGTKFGFASWYGDGLSKVKIKNPAGAAYADRSLTAANRTLPYGTILRVTNMDNGKYVDVVVNDNGPYVTGRIVDLSKSAFAQLQNPGIGIIMVQVEIKKN